MEQNPQTWWKVIAGRSDNNNWSEEGVSDTLEDVGQGSGGIQNFDSSEQDSDGTQSTVELPMGAEHIPSVEEPAASSAATDEALIP